LGDSEDRFLSGIKANWACDLLALLNRQWAHQTAKSIAEPELKLFLWESDVPNMAARRQQVRLVLPQKSRINKGKSCAW